MIVPLGLDHVDQVARLHCFTLTGLLTNLGETTVRSFYTGCVKSGSATGFVDLQNGKVRGFVLGSIHPDTLKRTIIQKNPFGIFAGLCVGFLRRPSTLIWFLKSFKGPDEGSYDPKVPELTYVAVSPECQGSGIGETLVDAFTQAIRDIGLSVYELSVDDDNERGAAFYESRGFKLIGRYREFGVVHRRYRFQ